MTGEIHESAQELSDITALLRRHGINPTTQRQEIAKILFAKPQHLSAEQLLAELQRREFCVSKATVYNTLNLFAAKGLVRQMVIDPDRIFYDSNTCGHYHLYNQDTGELQDLDAAQLSVQGIPELPEHTYQCGVDVIIRLRNKAVISNKS
jgi:Fur family iron response transcriptional regulator